MFVTRIERFEVDGEDKLAIEYEYNNDALDVWDSGEVVLNEEHKKIIKEWLFNDGDNETNKVLTP